jgi:aryl-phospho-beta-D-glucosidase BglC (GH1 family)
MKGSLLSLLTLSVAVSAWLPAERDLFGEQPNSVARSIASGKGRSVKRFGPSFNKIRGVNLGSLFIIEPWMCGEEWKSMGCDGAKSEFDCIMALGQEAGNAAFQKHWDSWITEQDMDKMKEYGLNTIRVPVGYWLVEDIVDRSSEHLPQGGMEKMDRLAEWAASRDMYVILDLHGAPGAQEPNQPFTGQSAGTSGFFGDYNYERAIKFLTTMTERIHQNKAYRTTGMIEVLNEPERNHGDLITKFYGDAYAAIRATEKTNKVGADQQLTIQFMDKGWGAGNPRDVLQGKNDVAFDNHRYLKWAPIEQSKNSYLSTSCSDTFGQGGNKPLVVGEWSLAVDSSVEWNADWDPTKEENKAFYKQWWAAQVQAYEKELGWTFWSWKTQLGGDWRWSYSAAVEAGVIPTDVGQAAGLAQC